MMTDNVLLSLALCRVTVVVRNWLKKVSPTLNVILEAVTLQLTVVLASVTSHTHTGPLYTQENQYDMTYLNIYNSHTNGISYRMSSSSG